MRSGVACVKLQNPQKYSRKRPPVPKRSILGKRPGTYSGGRLYQYNEDDFLFKL